MSQKVLLINRDDVMTHTSLGGNIDIDKLTPHIYNSQIYYLVPLLNSALYDKLIDLVDSGEISSATYSNYSTLLYDYVTPVLAHHTLEMYLPWSAYEFSNQGVSKRNPEDSVEAESERIDKLVQICRNLAAKTTKLLEKYLSTNSGLFVELTASDLEVDRIEHTNRGGFYLGGVGQGRKKIYGQYHGNKQS